MRLSIFGTGDFGDRLHVKLDLILDPQLSLGEAHAVARLVRRAVLHSCGEGAPVEVRPLRALCPGSGSEL